MCLDVLDCARRQHSMCRMRVRAPYATTSGRRVSGPAGLHADARQFVVVTRATRAHGSRACPACDFRRHLCCCSCVGLLEERPHFRRAPRAQPRYLHPCLYLYGSGDMPCSCATSVVWRECNGHLFGKREMAELTTKQRPGLGSLSGAPVLLKQGFMQQKTRIGFKKRYYRLLQDSVM